MNAFFCELWMRGTYDMQIIQAYSTCRTASFMIRISSVTWRSLACSASSRASSDTVPSCNPNPTSIMIDEQQRAMVVSHDIQASDQLDEWQYVCKNLTRIGVSMIGEYISSGRNPAQGWCRGLAKVCQMDSVTLQLLRLCPACKVTHFDSLNTT